MHHNVSQKHGNMRLIGTAAVLIAVCLLTGIAAGAGTFSIDTSGQTFSQDTETQIPVKISDASGMSAFTIRIYTDNPADADIKFGPTIYEFGYHSYLDASGKFTCLMPLNNPLSGNADLFYIKVTPKSTNSIPIKIQLIDVMEGSDTVSGYTAAETVISATGTPAAPAETTSPESPGTPSVAETKSGTPTSPTTSVGTPTDAPSASQTVTPTETAQPISPTHAEPSAQTAASPLPVLGILAGISASALILRRMKQNQS